MQGGFSNDAFGEQHMGEDEIVIILKLDHEPIQVPVGGGNVALATKPIDLKEIMFIIETQNDITPTGLPFCDFRAFKKGSQR